MKKEKLITDELNSISGGETSTEGHDGTDLQKEASIEKLLAMKGDEPMTVQDAMRLQMEFHQLNLQTEMTTKAGAKSDSIFRLLENQSPPKE